MRSALQLPCSGLTGAPANFVATAASDGDGQPRAASAVSPLRGPTGSLREGGSAISQEGSPDALSAELSLSDSDPSLTSPDSVVQQPASREGRPSSLAPGRADRPSTQVAAELPAATAATTAAPEAAALPMGPPPSFAWLLDLSSEQRRRLRQCQNPHDARSLLAEFITAGRRQDRRQWPPPPPAVPASLLEDLRRHTQAARGRSMDLEEALQQQAAAHKAELEALREEHRRALKRAKLQLLAHWAPCRATAREAEASLLLGVLGAGGGGEAPLQQPEGPVSPLSGARGLQQEGCAWAAPPVCYRAPLQAAAPWRLAQ